MEYKTSDIVLASTLKVKGFVLSGVELQGTRGVFVFEGVDQSILDDFDLGLVMVEPNQYHQAVKQLTTIVRRKTSQV